MVIALGLTAALLLGIGFVLQQHESAQVPPGPVRPMLLLDLCRRPVWLGGIGAMVLGQLLGAAALALGSLVVVEPLLSVNVLFALVLGAFVAQRRLSRGDWLGTLLLLPGLLLFLLGGSPSEAVDPHDPRPGTWLVAGAGLAVAVVLLLRLSSRRSPRPRAALLATAAGVLFGGQDFLTQRILDRLPDGVPAVLTSWQPWLLIPLAVVGLTLSQNAFRLADLSASLPPATLAEPVAGIALAVGVLGQRAFTGLVPAGCAALGLLMMVAGVVLLTRSPLVVDPHRRRHPPVALRR